MLRTIPLVTTPSWQEQLADLVTDPAELLAILQLNAEDVGLSAEAIKSFPLRVPRPYLARIKPGDPNDPLLLQVLPSTKETELQPGYSNDPLGELGVNQTPGLLHKYAGRVLLIATSSCAIHCRYCFRRHFPYSDNRPGRAQWQESFDYIAANPDIQEVILSGGDPLATSNAYLSWLVENLLAIPHVTRLRLHTRVPIMIPQRVDGPLIQLLGNRKQQIVVVLHANHAQEFDADVDSACQRLRSAGIHLLNQSVLLGGINDSNTALCELSERMFAAGVLPYYLHVLDKVNGAAHFDVTLTKARQLIQTMQGLLPGYLVPRLVREEAGMMNKIPL
ncbi:MAG: EF-P beta-lysylation protein EpmB [Pseudomonadota bacterium]